MMLLPLQAADAVAASAAVAADAGRIDADWLLKSASY